MSIILIDGDKILLQLKGPLQKVLDGDNISWAPLKLCNVWWVLIRFIGYWFGLFMGGESSSDSPWIPDGFVLFSVGFGWGLFLDISKGVAARYLERDSLLYFISLACSLRHSILVINVL